jgi:hypothetical protein
LRLLLNIGSISRPNTRAQSAKEASGTSSRRGSLSEPVNEPDQSGVSQLMFDVMQRLGNFQIFGGSVPQSENSPTQGLPEGATAMVSAFESQQQEEEEQKQPSESFNDAPLAQELGSTSSDKSEVGKPSTPRV